MSRQDRWSWFSARLQQPRRSKSASRANGRGFARNRRLRVEQLEDRRMLAVLSVSNLNDAGADSLREAVSMANSAPGADEIQFSVGGAIALTSGEIEITEALTITGTGQAALTIDANNASRIFNITATSGDFTIAGLTLTGGETTGGGTAGRGGAIRSLTTGSLTIDRSTVSESSTTGTNAFGGGIFSAGDLTLTNSTVSGNSTSRANGGGLYSSAAVSLTNSTISGNGASGFFSFPSSSPGRGGGIYALGPVSLTSSTITDNNATEGFARGGGIWGDSSITLSNSIVAGNTAGIFGLSPDIDSSSGTLDVVYSLLGTAVTPDSGGIGNLFDDNPLLGPLADNGGPTLPNGAAILTHALLFGSPAIDAGDVAAAPGNLGVPLYDQRGNNFGRVQNGQIDMGAFEVRKTYSANFDGDSDVDGMDFLAWQRGFGTAAPDATRLDGDADNDGDSDGADLSRWQDQFGQSADSLLGVPLEIEFTPATLVDSLLIDINNTWFGQGEYFLDIKITGLNGGFAHHGKQLVAIDDTTVFDANGSIASVIVDWTTDTIPSHQNEIYTVCIQILRFLGDDGTFELFSLEKCVDFGPF